MIFNTITLLNFFIQLLFFSIHSNWCWSWRQLFWQCLWWLVCNMHPWCKIWASKYPSCCFQSSSSLDWSMTRSFQCSFQNKKLFNVSLIVYPHKKVHIDCKPGAKSVYDHAYHVSHIHWKRTGLPYGASEWASLAFIIPKKDGQVQ